MNGEKFNNAGAKFRVLVSPLDWGLGHAARCIPIIRKLLSLHCEVFIASGNANVQLLKQEFPDLVYFSIKEYDITYSRYRKLMPLKLFMQLPRLAIRVRAENKWLREKAKELGLHLIISDNRFGMYHKDIPSVYITHQLKIKAGNRFTEWLLQKMHYHFINKFTHCWVPDMAGDINLAGELSHPKVLPKIPVSYLGPLSRLNKHPESAVYDITILLSGPEPLRSIFENDILKQATSFPGKIILLRGLPASAESLLSPLANMIVYNHLPADELNRVVLQSKMIIGRCGYSTVMDLFKLQKKAILVPTPGQTEQEYLATYLSGKKLFYCISQRNFLLDKALKEAAAFSFEVINCSPDENDQILEKIILAELNAAKFQQ